MDSGVFPVVGPLEAQACSCIAAGHGFSAAVAEDGRLFTWGGNDDHRLGTESEQPVEVLRPAAAPTLSLHCSPPRAPQLSSVPLHVRGFDAAVTLVALGGAHACAATAAGTLWCWGDGSCGQLGLGPAVRASSKPARVDSLSGTAQAVACGANFTLVCTTSGLFAFGANGDGQLGIGRAGAEAWTPGAVALDGPANGASAPRSGPFARPAAGAAFALALRWDGTVFAWGSDTDGALGLCRGSRSGHVASPMRVKGLAIEGVVCVDASCGERHAVVVTEGGRLLVWGANDRGQLGLGSRTPVDAPTPLQALAAAPVASVSCGARHSVAVGRSGELFVWGAGDGGRLAYAADAEAEGGDRLLPVMLDNAVLAVERNRAVAAACGHDHTLVLTEGGALFAWGPLDVDGDYGQIGAGHLEEPEDGRACWYYLAEDGSVQGPFSHADMGGWMGQFFGEELPVYYLPADVAPPDPASLEPSCFHPLSAWYQDMADAFLARPDGPAAGASLAENPSPPAAAATAATDATDATVGQDTPPEGAVALDSAPLRGEDEGEGGGDARGSGRPQALDVLRSLAGMPATPPAPQRSDEDGEGVEAGAGSRGRATSPAVHFAPAARTESGAAEGGEGEGEYGGGAMPARSSCSSGDGQRPTRRGESSPGASGPGADGGLSAAEVSTGVEAYEALDTSSLPEAQAAVRALRHDLAAALAARDEALQTVASLQGGLRGPEAGGEEAGSEGVLPEGQGQTASLQRHLARETAALERGMSSLRREVVRAQVRNACQVLLHAGARHATACRHLAFRRLHRAATSGGAEEGSGGDDAHPRIRALAAALQHSRSALARAQRQRAAQALVAALRLPCARRARRGLQRWAAAGGVGQPPHRPDGRDAVRVDALQRLVARRARVALGGAMRSLYANAVRTNATASARNAHRRLQQRLQQRQRELDGARMCAVRDKLVSVWRGRSRHSVRAAFLRWFTLSGVAKCEAGLRRQRLRLRTTQERAKKEQQTFEEAEGRLDRACHLVRAVAAFQRWRGNVQGQQRAALVERLREERELLASELLRVYKHIGAVRQGEESWRESAGIRGHQLLRDARTLNSAIGTAQVAAERACSYALAGLDRAATLAAKRQEAVARAAAAESTGGTSNGVPDEGGSGVAPSGQEGLSSAPPLPPARGGEEEEEEKSPTPAELAAARPQQRSPLGRLKALREARAARGAQPSPSVPAQREEEMAAVRGSRPSTSTPAQGEVEKEAVGSSRVPPTRVSAEESNATPPSMRRLPPSAHGRLKARRASHAGLALRSKSAASLISGRSAGPAAASPDAAPTVAAGGGEVFKGEDGTWKSPGRITDALTPQSAPTDSHVAMSPLRALRARAESITPNQAKKFPATGSPTSASGTGLGGPRKSLVGRLGSLRRASIAVAARRRNAGKGPALQRARSPAAEPTGDDGCVEVHGKRLVAVFGVGGDQGEAHGVFGMDKGEDESGGVFGVGGDQGESHGVFGMDREEDESGGVLGVGGDEGGSGGVFGMGGDEGGSGGVFGLDKDEDESGGVFGVGGDEDESHGVFGVGGDEGGSGGVFGMGGDEGGSGGVFGVGGDEDESGGMFGVETRH